MTNDRQLLIVTPDSNIAPTDETLELLLEELLITEDFRGGILRQAKAYALGILNVYNPRYILQKLQGKEISSFERAIYVNTAKDLLLYLMRRLYQLDLPKMMPEALVVSPNDQRLKDYQCSDEYFLANIVYVRHPASPNYFLRLAEFHDKLLDEKRNEFLQLLVSLGAKRIYLIDKNQQGKGGAVGVKLDDPTNVADIGTEINVGQFSSSEIKVEGEFDLPANLPQVPDGLKWLKKESSWKTIVHGRTNGNWMKSYKVSFTYTQDFGITSGLAAKVEGFGVNIGGNFSSMRTINQEYAIEFYSHDDYSNVI
ncbi:hypothetical protein [Nodularia sphaerocarpa]|uniref:hypothetical protein n=1 Tax=Nodularia sphaerocarpa TaxID=137816 RepID=UPI001EFB16ED|nr:hypothetical protein [Nodularia sphaerocarpa]MDB9374800.1 hypothetical protein [Nodularia sphaerocarpa CS-585]MDB9377131.1 hypothetical protein [Nodularia sphaerocarpa CS-585A2]ULP70539.1 hypothetical protein BDGGKGIB_00155 [Nodularia sphaerocarpa UHCC 0038]